MAEGKPGNDEPSDDLIKEVASGKFFTKLIKVPLDEHKARPMAREAFSKAMAHPRAQVENRLWQPKVGSNNVEVRDF